MDIRKLRQIRRVLKEKFKPEQVEYIRLDNNKMIIIEPGMNGSRTIFSYAIGMYEQESLREFNLDALSKEYPGYNLVDSTEKINKIAEELSKAMF